jgi:hypothetical protein
MKSVPSLTLIATLMSSVLPLAAQDRMGPTSDDIHQAMREDARIVDSALFSDRSFCLRKMPGATYVRCAGPENSMPFWKTSERSASGPAFRSTTTPSRNSMLVGGLVGFGIGAALGTTVGAEACLQEPRWHCAFKVAVPIAALGALVGWLHK